MSIFVCDIGTSSLKLGYTGDSTPRCVVPTVVGVANKKRQDGMIKSDENHFLYGASALDPKLVSSRYYPMESGIVRDWQVMEDVLNFGLGALHDSSYNKHFLDRNEDIYEYRGSKILLTEPTLNTTENRKKLFECMFENMKFDAVNLTNQSLLVLYARGLLSGMVVECGEGITQVVPVNEGIVPYHLIKRHGVTGNNITMYLKKLLQLQGFNSNFLSDTEILRCIKESLCYTSCDLDEDRRLARETTALVETFSLPDGTVVKVGQERFEASEAFFDPSLLDMECRGLSDFVFDTIQESDIDCRVKLYEHIVLSGGSSMFPGMSTRLKQDIQRRYFNDILKGDEKRTKKIRISVEAPVQRAHSVFLGGAVLAGLMENRDDFWVTKVDYEECGIEKILSHLQL